MVFGASSNPERYSFIATNMLKEFNHDIVLYGNRKGEISGTLISVELPIEKDFDTVTLYVNPKLQTDFYEFIINLKPKRVIFNPGTENAEFKNVLQQNQIEAIEACTLVMLRTGQY